MTATCIFGGGILVAFVLWLSVLKGREMAAAEVEIARHKAAAKAERRRHG